jgi:exonuclease III
MKGIFWNSNGLRDQAKTRFLFDLTKEQQLDFIALLETKKSDYTTPELSHLCTNKTFCLSWAPPNGCSGGILVGVNSEKFTIQNFVHGNFHVKFKLQNKYDNFEWILIAVYGAAQEEEKERFLRELVQTCNVENLPLIVGGDFNIIRKSQEKNNNRYNDKWPFLFNAVINSLDLRELELSGRQFTWANRLQNPTYEKLDRILVSTEWELKYPKVTVHALTREVSDHTPLLLDTGMPSSHSPSTFKFELSWLFKDGFYNLVSELWQKEMTGSTPMEIWQNKIRSLRKYLRGWAKNMNGAYKKEKKELTNRLEQLDKKAEKTMLLPHEVDLKHCLNARLLHLLREEEIKWYQRSKSDKLLQGDSNTKYFHLIANGKHRKTCIFQLEDNGQTIRGDEHLMTYITQFYKTLFGPSDDDNFSLDENRVNDIPQISAEDNEKLTAVFTEKEVKEAIFQMKHNKAPGPDGFPVEFYQVFWEIIKGDLMALFKQFHEGNLPLFSLNFGIITLLPKQNEATHIRQYRPIYLLNVSFKIFTKVVVNRITDIAEKVISPSQSAFIPGRNIMEGVVMLHETIHELHRKKMNGVILKLDFEKAYDKVN